MKTYLSIIMAFTALFCFVFYGCSPSDDDNTPADNDVSAVVDNVKSEEAVTSTFNTINHYGINEDGIKSLEYDSTIVESVTHDTVSANGFPVTLVLNFGNGYLGPDGRMRKGKLIAAFTGKWGKDSIAAGTNVEITFENFSVDNVVRQGKIKVTYNGGYELTEPQPSFTSEAIDLKLVETSGKSSLLNGSRTVKCIQGAGNLNEEDDIWEISGSMTGTSLDGKTYTSTILTGFPLKRDNTCSNTFIFTSGKVELIPEGKKTRTIDFGDGSCDNDIVINIEGYQTNWSF